MPLLLLANFTPKEWSLDFRFRKHRINISESQAASFAIVPYSILDKTFLYPCHFFMTPDLVFPCQHASLSPFPAITEREAHTCHLAVHYVIRNTLLY